MGGDDVTRREFLQVVGLLASTGAATQLSGCRHGRAEQSPDSIVDATFARLALHYVHAPSTSLRGKLLDHPALEAIERHAQMSGDRASKAELLDRVLRNTTETTPSSVVLDAWEGRTSELAARANLAKELLPAGAPSVRRIYLLTGYDIGVAAPPDILLNVIHPHFQSAPTELGFYATHEAHHVGLIGIRPPPALSGLETSQHLLSVVRYFTQLEGMAVHAAFPSRSRDGALGDDGDYRVYGDPQARAEVMSGYKKLFEEIRRSTVLADDTIGRILTGMSSGDRLWYRFGAIVANVIEKTHGRQQLVATVTTPDAFDAVADNLLAKA